LNGSRTFYIAVFLMLICCIRALPLLSFSSLFILCLNLTLEGSQKVISPPWNFAGWDVCRCSVCSFSLLHVIHTTHFLGAVAFCEKDLHCWQWLHGNLKKKKKRWWGKS